MRVNHRMYVWDVHLDHHTNRVRYTREADRTVFQTEICQNCKYKNSSYCKGAQSWKTLPLDLTNVPCLIMFKRDLKKLYKTYSDEL